MIPRLFSLGARSVHGTNLSARPEALLWRNRDVSDRVPRSNSLEVVIVRRKNYNVNESEHSDWGHHFNSIRRSSLTLYEAATSAHNHWITACV